MKNYCVISTEDIDEKFLSKVKPDFKESKDGLERAYEVIDLDDPYWMNKRMFTLKCAKICLSDI